jgi:sugar lactone lactonase YvrE
MPLTPKVILDGLVFPEGPRWRDGKLWFVDMMGKKVMTVDPEGHSELLTEMDDMPSGLGWMPDGTFLIVSRFKRQVLKLDANGLHVHADLTGHAESSLNDMVVDSQGRAYVDAYHNPRTDDPGTAPGSVVLVTPDGTPRTVAEDLVSPNGSVITPDGKTYIVAQTRASELTAFDIEEDGSLSNRRPFAKLDEKVPDGICLDAEGAIWVGSYRTGEFLRVKEGGEVTDRISYEDKLAVACMLGGEDRRTLFLLTGTVPPSATDTKEPPMGWIETVRVDVPGAGLP